MCLQGGWWLALQIQEQTSSTCKGKGGKVRKCQSRASLLAAVTVAQTLLGSLHQEVLAGRLFLIPQMPRLAWLGLSLSVPLCRDGLFPEQGMGSFLNELLSWLCQVPATGGTYRWNSLLPWGMSAGTAPGFAAGRDHFLAGCSLSFLWIFCWHIYPQEQRGVPLLKLGWPL